MKRIPQVLEKSDNYCLENKEKHSADKTDSEMHNRVWSEGAKLRTSGVLIEIIKNIKSRLYLIQGEYDLHPVNGVTIQLQENGVGDCVIEEVARKSTDKNECKEIHPV